MEATQQRIRWFVPGDINGFFGLMVDNVAMLAFLAAILLGCGFPAEIVFGKMFPGTALGVLFGDLVYSWMAWRLAKRTGNPNVTSMPLGLDTPSTIGLALAVLVPVFNLESSRMISEAAIMGMPLTQADVATAAAEMAWYVGMAIMVCIGLFKVLFAYIGPWLQKLIPGAALLGSLAGIGFALLGFLPLVDIFGLPIVGALSLGLILYAVIARIKLPFNIPGVLMAVIAGSALYYLLAPSGLLGVQYSAPTADLHLGFPMPTLDFARGMEMALNFLPVAIPFALLTSIGGINVTESARAAGDDFKTKTVLLVDAASALIAGVCGGVVQTTPYIGQPAYKAMGSRIGYTLLVGVFVGLGGMLGYVSFIVELIPKAVLAPILVFVALEIISQAFRVGGSKYAPAVAFACFPTISNMLTIKLNSPDFAASAQAALSHLPGKALPEMLVVLSLGNGFIITAMLWGAAVIKLIDRKLHQAAAYFLTLSVLSFFGLIHSVNTNGSMYLPWTLPAPLYQIPYQFSAAYLVLALVIFALSYTKQSREAFPEHGH